MMRKLVVALMAAAGFLVSCSDVPTPCKTMEREIHQLEQATSGQIGSVSELSDWVKLQELRVKYEEECSFTPTTSTPTPTVCTDVRDADADGYTVCDGDCNDLSPNFHPGATESCNYNDLDCDGVDGRDEVDNDGDAYTVCDGDCDDDDPAKHPYAEEECDGIDNDCSGRVDDADDNDYDGYDLCEGECDDTNEAVHPGVHEVCNGVDDDCDGTKDENFDDDRDGFPTCDVGSTSADCDDGDATIYPGSTEVCNGVDDDCNGDEDEGFDEDDDGVTTCAGDCDDDDPDVHPGLDATEVCGNSVDDDCDGIADEGFDEDDDGVTTCGGDCDDTNPAAHPGVLEVCGDHIDNDCDGPNDDQEVEDCLATVDTDGDGTTFEDGDCDDTEGSIYPGATEFCNSSDDDCDGETDEDGDKPDLDGDSYAVEDGDCDDHDPDVHPGVLEVCNGIDDDCDGKKDESNYTTYDQWYYDTDKDGYGGGGEVVKSCADLRSAGYRPYLWGKDCNEAYPSIHPDAPDLCNGIDDDCDGKKDNERSFYDGDDDGAGDPYQFAEVSSCAPPIPDFVLDDGDCDDKNPAIHPGALDVCDGIDNDCSGHYVPAP